MAPFYGWGSTASRLEPLRGGSLLFSTKFPEIYIYIYFFLSNVMQLHFRQITYNKNEYVQYKKITTHALNLMDYNPKNTISF